MTRFPESTKKLNFASSSTTGGNDTHFGTVSQVVSQTRRGTTCQLWLNFSLSNASIAPASCVIQLLFKRVVYDLMIAPVGTVLHEATGYHTVSDLVGCNLRSVGTNDHFYITFVR